MMKVATVCIVLLQRAVGAISEPQNYAHSFRGLLLLPDVCKLIQEIQHYISSPGLL
jgi:hypothetical protein